MVRYRFLLFIIIILGIHPYSFAGELKSNYKYVINPIIKSAQMIELGEPSNRSPKLLSGILDTLRNHDNFAGGVFIHVYDSTYLATRLTMPTRAVSACTIKIIRYYFHRPLYTANAPCSLFIWNDTVVNGIHKPGSIKLRSYYDFRGRGTGDTIWIISFTFTGAPLIYNPGEHFWLGIINFNETVRFLSDASSNPDTTRNERRVRGGTWISYYLDFYFDAIVSYEPPNNDIGILSVQDVDKVLRCNDTTPIKANVKNFGNNTLDSGIPVILKITGPSFTVSDTEYTETSLPTNATELITFSPDWQVPNITGDYEISVWTRFDLDSIYSNDTTHLSVFVYSHGQRETFFQVDFPPAGWLVFNYNNDNEWQRTTSASGYYTSPAGAIISYDRYPYYPNNDWLVSPRFQAQPEDSIIFFYRAASSARMETLLVRLNFNSTRYDTASYQIIRRIATNNFNWQRCVIALNSYLLQTDTISIAFHYPSYYKFYIAIDDIITPQPLHSIDFITKSIDRPLLPIIVDSTYVPLAKFRNNSIDTMTPAIRVYYKITGDSTDYLDSLTEGIEPGNSEAFSFASFSPVVSETVEIKVWVEYEEDENNSNDTITKKVFIAPKYQSVPYSANFNEQWGKYGDNPPFGGWRIIDEGNEWNRIWNTNDWHKDTTRIGTTLRTFAKVSFSPVENQLERLISPRLNCSIPGNYTLSYWHWYRDYSVLTLDSGVVLISNNGGQNWNRIVRYSNASDSGLRIHNITPLVSGYQDVRVCFLYGAYDEWWWCIDDFAITYMLATPQLIYPPNGFETLANSIEMRWQPVPGASKYVIQLAYDSLFYYTLRSETIVNSTSYIDSLPPYRYFWRVKAGEPYSNWSETRCFTITSPPPPVYGWQQLKSITVPLYGKNVKDGGALVFCALDSNIYAFKGNNTREFYAYKINQDSWYTKQEIDVDTLKDRKIKKGSALSSGDTLIYAVKGNTNELWVYNPRTNTWILKKYIPGRALKGGTGIVYVGQTKNTKNKCHRDTENTETNHRFTQMDTEEKNRVYLCAPVVNSIVKENDKLSNSNDFIYLLKGGNRDFEFWAYSVNNDSWIRKQRAPGGKPFKDGSALVYDGFNRIYALKGGFKINEFYFYDINADTWSRDTISAIPLQRTLSSKKYKVKSGGSLTIIDSKIYAIKGGGCPELWCYSIINNRANWIAVDTIPRLANNYKKSVPKDGAALTSAYGKVYLLKGNKTDEFWSFLLENIKITSPEAILANDEFSNINAVSTNLISPSALELKPNPCQTFTNISFGLSKPAFVTMKLYDRTGRLIKPLYKEYLLAGSYQQLISFTDLSSGVYFIGFDNGDRELISKLIIK